MKKLNFLFKSYLHDNKKFLSLRRKEQDPNPMENLQIRIRSRSIKKKFGSNQIKIPIWKHNHASQNKIGLKVVPSNKSKRVGP